MLGGGVLLLPTASVVASPSSARCSASRATSMCAAHCTNALLSATAAVAVGAPGARGTPGTMTAGATTGGGGAHQGGGGR